jgi:hypothetical protein
MNVKRRGVYRGMEGRGGYIGLAQKVQRGRVKMKRTQSVAIGLL